MLYWGIFVVELIFLFYTSKFIYQSLFVLLYRVFRRRGFAEKIIFLIFFPGVIIHELSHMFFAEITFVKTFNLDIAPRFEDGYLRMGSVEVQQTDPARRAIIGLAPLLAGIIIISSILIFLGEYLGPRQIFSSPESFLLHVVVGWVIFLIANTMFSSRKDLEGLMAFLLAVAFVVLVGSVATILLSQDPFSILIAVLSSSISVELAKTGAVSLLVPVVINGSIFLLAKFLTKNKNS